MTESDPHSFDLIDQPWLLVRRLDGSVTELSLLETFRQSGDLAGLVGEVPTQVFALTRILLAVVHDVTEGPRDLDEWSELWSADELPVEDIAAYLDRCRDRFDLFHPRTPFLQVAGLRTAKGEVSGLDKIIADIPNGKPFFSTRLGSDQALTFAEAARWVVHCHAFDPSGIKSGAVGDDRVKGGKGYPIGTGWSGYLGGVLPEGANLRETLLLNLIARDFDLTAADACVDRPAWRRAPVTAGVEDPDGRAPTGPVDLFTWQSRRIRLVPQGDKVVGVLVCNGDRVMPQNKFRFEPHSAWRRSQAQEKKLREPTVYMPLEHDPERAIWRGLQALLPQAAAVGQSSEASARLAPGVLKWLALLGDDVIGPDFPIRLRTIGMTYGSQSSTTAEIIDDALSIQSILLSQSAAELRGKVLSCVEAAENGAKALGSLAANLTAASGGDPAGSRERAKESAYAELDGPFRDWVSRLGPNSDAIEQQVLWHRLAGQVVRGLGQDLLDRASPSSWTGRVVKNRLVTSSHADIWFHRELREAFRLAYPDIT
ncbi:type I-E CRISPR-associated protein Cse1/CasA [Actinokineospora iranica]|uniref:CRISPR-associated protein, Cse1 family n=1 Tax=Actinokineospora iranica TaxID=1271860 RepID=A0A1G6N986_9PSEU|nr:type I-E CRISPR-associated protein Cse1/CasA [Actinokineospora iranica]SDC64363.1 CRISPR-associated protein, Cse1 family [Actinokineospora iranica]